MGIKAPYPLPPLAPPPTPLRVPMKLAYLKLRALRVQRFTLFQREAFTGSSGGGPAG